ncbi:MAG: tetrahydromethanopterin S-methyltransferase subunit F [Methanosarcinales archaeon]|nr:tetrahydromethanopterin S-methyltransferase subunit F [Methanosarcinales archaeon]
MAEDNGNNGNNNESGVPLVIAPPMGPIDAVVDRIRYRGQLIVRNQRLDSAVNATGVVGFAIGFLFAVLMMGLPLVMMK